ncbi:hypothetical protein [Haliangium sp.]
MATARRQGLMWFREALEDGRRDDADVALFRLLYGLSAEVQIGLARDMTARFLPIFRANHPDVDWPVKVLDDLDAHFREHEQGLPEEPPDCSGGDPAFMYALYALLRALSYAKQGELPRVTPACCTALAQATHARARNVWHADDPEAVQAFDDDDWERLHGRSMHDNVAAQAVRKREWLLVADWLEARVAAEALDAPVMDEPACEQWLAWWQERAGNL